MVTLWPWLVAAGDGAGLLAMLLAAFSASLLPLCLILGEVTPPPSWFSFLVGLGASSCYLVILLGRLVVAAEPPGLLASGCLEAPQSLDGRRRRGCKLQA